MKQVCNVVFTAAVILAMAASTNGCSGSSSSPESDKADAFTEKLESADQVDSGSIQSTVLTGVFLDSPVGNIDYRTDTLSGITSAAGEFSYRDGETINFSIGDLKLPTVTAAPVITPADMSAPDRGALNDDVVNILRLLQSLDVDGDPANGITIAPEAKLNATEVIFAQSIAGFAASTAVTQLLPNAGLTIISTGLIPVVNAVSHFEEQLARLENNDANGDASAATRYDPATPSGRWLLTADSSNGLAADVQISFTSGTALLVERRCMTAGVLTDLRLPGSWRYNRSNGVLTTAIVRRTGQVCDDGKVASEFSTRRLRWLNGNLEGLSSNSSVFSFVREGG